MADDDDKRRDLVSTLIKAALIEILQTEVERQGITLYEVAKRAALNDQTVRDIASGRTIPKLDAVLRLEAGLGKPGGWISKTVLAITQYSVLWDANAARMAAETQQEAKEMAAATKKKKKPK